MLRFKNSLTKGAKKGGNLVIQLPSDTDNLAPTFAAHFSRSTITHDFMLGNILFFQNTKRMNEIKTR